VGADGKGPLEGRCLGDVGTVGLVVVRHYKTGIKSTPLAVQYHRLRQLLPKGGSLWRSKPQSGKDSVAACGPLVPQDVSPDDIESSGLVAFPYH